MNGDISVLIRNLGGGGGWIVGLEHRNKEEKDTR